MSYQQPPGYPPQGGGAYGPPPSGYGPPQGGPPGGGYGPPPMQQQPQKKGMSVAAIILIILGILIVLGGGSCAMCVCMGAKGVSDAVDQINAEDAKAKAHPLNVSLDKLVAAYAANEVSADATYKNKYLLVTGGTVESINKDIADAAYIVVNKTGSFEVNSVHCRLTKASMGAAASLKKGAKVSVFGKDTGMIIGSVMLENCEMR